MISKSTHEKKHYLGHNVFGSGLEEVFQFLRVDRHRAELVPDEAKTRFLQPGHDGGVVAHLLPEQLHRLFALLGQFFLTGGELRAVRIGQLLQVDAEDGWRRRRPAEGGRGWWRGAAQLRQRDRGRRRRNAVAQGARRQDVLLVVTVEVGEIEVAQRQGTVHAVHDLLPLQIRL